MAAMGRTRQRTSLAQLMTPYLTITKTTLSSIFMTQKPIFLFGSISSCLLACQSANEESSEENPLQHPNILFILADDMGYGDPQSYNPQSKIPTPNIDRIAQNGVRFTDAHSPSPWYVREGLVIGEQVVWQGSWKFIRGEEGSLSRVYGRDVEQAESQTR